MLTMGGQRLDHPVRAGLILLQGFPVRVGALWGFFDGKLSILMLLVNHDIIRYIRMVAKVARMPDDYLNNVSRFCEGVVECGGVL